MKTNKFEDNLKELETLSQQIKSGDLPLDETVKCFEKGMKLADTLEKEISEIEGKVEFLVNRPSKNEESEPEFKDFQE